MQTCDLDESGAPDRARSARAPTRPFRPEGVYLDSAAVHPMPTWGVEALTAYAEARAVPRTLALRGASGGWELRSLFASLINAQPDDVVLTSSTMAGENLIALGLGLGAGGGAVATDVLHFQGSLYLYAELARRGLDLTVLPQEGGRIPIEAYEKAIKPGGLVAVSAISNVNGFEHDLARLCDVAHARGAFVFADIIQAIGAVPFDVQASRIDACACSSYKWLMGDFGVGFLYTRPETRGRLKRILHGHDQLERFDVANRWDDGDAPRLDYAATAGAHGLFAVGTKAAAAVAATTPSLRFLVETGVDDLVARRRPLMSLLRARGAERGWRCLTPAEARGPIITFAHDHARARFGARLADAGVAVTLSDASIRVSPSVFNTPDDIERLFDALA